jgi:hypothetical protein
MLFGAWPWEKKMSKAVGRRREKYQRKRKYKGSIVILSFGAPSEAVLPNMVKKQLSFTKKATHEAKHREKSFTSEAEVCQTSLNLSARS